MEFRLANVDDLPQLKAIYMDIIHNMNKENIQIWDEIYPCEFFCDDIANNCLYILVEYLRLFVVDINKPAINLYIKNGFQKADGIYDEIIGGDIILHELGFEIETSI